jgi:DNA-binding transcriptional LysR family regulator
MVSAKKKTSRNLWDAAKWDDLRIFLEVARHGTVHAAARQLRLDHSTVCRRIGRLETLLAVKLLDRSRKGVFVRPEAQGLLQHIEEMDQHASSLADMIVGDASKAVRIATMEGLASGYIARCVPALARFDSTMKVELVSIPQVVDLNRKEADVFLSFFNPATRGLRSFLVGSFSLFLYSSPDYLRRNGKPRSRAELSKHVFVGYIDDLLAIDAVRWLDEVIVSPRMSFQSNSVFAQRNAAEQGMGIVLLPTFVASDVPGLERILPDRISIRREVWASVRTEQSHLQRIKTILEFLKYIFIRDSDFLAGMPDQRERCWRD